VSKPQRPSVGRIVHHLAGDECHAAIVVAVHADDDLTLHVFPPAGTAGQLRAVEDPTARRSGTWHWPAKVS
jgi:hypothetical protein